MNPCFTVLTDNVNLNSLGLPAVTVTFVTVAARGWAIAGAATRPHPPRHAAAINRALVMSRDGTEGKRREIARGALAIL
jgi:hypothetical protein